MSMMKLLEHGQVTIPKNLRDALGLKKGDLVEAELDQGRIVITPKKPVRKKAWQELMVLLEEVHSKNKGVSEKLVTRDVLKAIAELRGEEHAQATRTKDRS